MREAKAGIEEPVELILVVLWWVGKWSWLREDRHRIQAWTGKVVLDMSLKVTQHRRINAELPLQVRAHLLLHLVDLPKREHPLTNNTPFAAGKRALRCRR